MPGTGRSFFLDLRRLPTKRHCLFAGFSPQQPILLGGYLLHRLEGIITGTDVWSV